MKRKLTYEWIFVINKGEEQCLTENQYKFYREHKSEGTITFKDFGINPSFVVQFYKQPAERLFEKYPCLDCHKTGYIQIVPDDVSKGLTYKECPVCRGTGLDFNYVPKTE